MSLTSISQGLCLLLLGFAACQPQETLLPDLDSDASLDAWKDLPWVCAEPFQDYFLATQRHGSVGNTYEALFGVGSRSVNFEAVAADGDILQSSRSLGFLDKVFIQAQSCHGLAVSDEQCALVAAIEGRYGPFKSDPTRPYLFDWAQSAWCHDPGEPLYFSGMLTIYSLKKTLAVRLQDTGERPVEPFQYHGVWVKILALQMTLLEVDPSCTYDALPCDGTLLATGTLHRLADIPPEYL